MHVSLLLLAAVVSQAPQVELETLKGERQAGKLARLSSEEVSLEGTAGLQSLKTADVLEIRFPEVPAAKPESPAPPVLLSLGDGSRIEGTAATATGRTIQVATSRLGSVAFPSASVVSLRLSTADPKLEAAWAALLDKDRKKDLLVIRKGEVLDYLSGVVGDIDDQTVKFLLDQDEIPVKRDKIYGIIYQRRTTPAAATRGSAAGP